MNVSLGDRREKFVETVVREGRYASASDVVREGLRLVEIRDRKLRALRETLAASVAAGGKNSEEEIDAALEAEAEALRRKGY